MPHPAKPAKQRTEVRQANLLDAALTLAAQRSPGDITTGDLARAVGISQGAVFKHFVSKEAIWLAVMDWASTTLMARLQTVADQTMATPAANSTPALNALHAIFMAHVAFVAEHPGVPRLIFQELQRPGDTAMKVRVRLLMQQYRQLLTRLLAQAHADQSIDPEVDTQAAAVLFIGTVQGLVMQSLLQGDVSTMTAQAPSVYAIYQRGLRACKPI